MLFSIDEKVITNGEWAVLRKEAVVPYLKVLSRTSPVETEENHAKESGSLAETLTCSA